LAKAGNMYFCLVRQGASAGQGKVELAKVGKVQMPGVKASCKCQRAKLVCICLGRVFARA
jgi:hypothetical protein